MLQYITDYTIKLNNIKLKALEGNKLIQKYNDSMDNIMSDITKSMKNLANDYEHKLATLNIRIMKCDPKLLKTSNVLILDEQSNIISNYKDIKQNKKLKIEFETGYVQVTVNKKWKK